MRVSAWEQVILALLIDCGPSYGLELVGGSKGRLTRGGIYVALGRMEDKGFVSSSPSESGRRVYTATALGQRALAASRLFSGEIGMAGA